jgi:protein TonB
MNFAQQQRNPMRHLAGVTFVIALHVLIVWAMLTGLAQKVVEVVKAPLETKIIQEIKPPPPPPPPPPSPKMVAPPPPFIPPPEIVVATPPPVTNTIQVTTRTAPPEPAPMVPTAPPVMDAPVNQTPTPAAPPAPPLPKPSVRTAPVIDAKKGCEEPEYPSASRRNEETGTVLLRFLIDVDGRVIDSKIATSSGFSRLDRAARDALSRCVFKPGTVDGKPEQSWADIRYTWKLD